MRPLRLGLATLLVGAGLASGCARRAVVDPCKREGRRFELRTREGALVFGLLAPRGPEGDLPICDAEERFVGTLSARAPHADAGASAKDEGPPTSRTLAWRNIAGDPTARLLVRPGEDAVVEASGRSLRLHDAGGLLRILDGAGVPLAQVGEVGGALYTYDPGGRVTGRAERVSTAAPRLPAPKDAGVEPPAPLFVDGPGRDELPRAEKLAGMLPDGAVTYVAAYADSDPTSGCRLRATAVLGFDRIPLPERLLIAAELCPFSAPSPSERRAR